MIDCLILQGCSSIFSCFCLCLSVVKGNEMANLGNYQAAVDLFTKAINLDAKDFRFVNCLSNECLPNE